MTPLLHDFENGYRFLDIDFSDSGKAADKTSKLITHHSTSLADPSVVTAKRTNKRNVYVRLPEDVKTACSHCKVAFESWKNNDYSDGNGINENYRLQAIADTWILKESGLTQPSNQKVVSGFSLDH